VSSNLLIDRFDRIYSDIRAEFDSATADDAELAGIALSNEQLEQVEPFKAERYFIGGGLRALAKSCREIADGIRARPDQINRSPRVLAHLENVAEIAERYSDSQLTQFRGIQGSIRDRAK